MDRVSDDIETLVWIDGKGRPRITQTIKSEKTVEFEIMDRINEKRLEWLLGGLDLDVWKMPEHIRNNFTSALTELRERRAAETAPYDGQQCPYCKWYHDPRLACTTYAQRNSD